MDTPDLIKLLETIPPRNWQVKNHSTVKNPTPTMHTILNNIEYIFVHEQQGFDLLAYEIHDGKTRQYLTMIEGVQSPVLENVFEQVMNQPLN